MTGRFGLGCGKRTNRRETTLSNHRTTPQARHAKRPLRRRQAHGCHAYLPSAIRSRRLHAPASFVRAIADVLLVDHAPPTRLSWASRKRLYLCPALPSCSPIRYPCPLTTRTSLSLLRPPSNPQLLIKALGHPSRLTRSSGRHLSLSAMPMHPPHRTRLLPSRCRLLWLQNLVSHRKWVPHGRQNSKRHPRLV